MAFGSRFVKGMIPEGLSPEDEEFLRRQLFSGLGQSLMANAFSGGSWNTLGSTMEPLQQLPQQAMKLMQFRQEQEDRERQQRMEAVRMQMAAEDQSMQREDQDLQRKAAAERSHASAQGRREKDAAWEASFEDSLVAGNQREEKLRNAEAYLASQGDKLGPSAEVLRQEIELLRGVPTNSLTRQHIDAFVKKFYGEGESAIKGERDFKFRQGQEARIAAGPTATPRITSATKFGGMVVTDKATGKSRFEPIEGMPDTQKPSGVDGRLWSAARKMAYDAVVGTMGDLNRALTDSEEQKIQELTWEFYENDARKAGLAGSTPGLPSSGGGPLDAFLGSLQRRSP